MIFCPPCGFSTTRDTGAPVQSASIDRLTASDSAVVPIFVGVRVCAIQHRTARAQSLQRKAGEVRMGAPYRFPYRVGIEAALAAVDRVEQTCENFTVAEPSRSGFDRFEDGLCASGVIDERTALLGEGCGGENHGGAAETRI